MTAGWIEYDRTEPFPIFEVDIPAIRLVAELEERSPQDVIHAALLKYMVDNGGRLFNFQGDPRPEASLHR
jgi:hypothetical protein